MVGLIFRRVLATIPTIFLVASITFILVRIVPGGPFDEEKSLPPEIIANINAKYNLDKPVHEQYLLYLSRIAHGDLGVSYKYVNRSVNDILKDALPVSIQLGFLGLFIAIAIGLPLGTIAAINRQSKIDHFSMLISTIGISVPGFVVGALLIHYFALCFHLLPAALWESPYHMILPALTLAASPSAYLARLTRASVLEIVEKDWVRTARCKGLSYNITVIKHILRNALIPVVTVLGPLCAILITGSFIVEYMYAIPGMGRFFVTAVMNRDYDLIVGTTIVFALLLIIANMLVDIAYGILDPRLKVD